MIPATIPFALGCGDTVGLLLDLGPVPSIPATHFCSLPPDQLIY
jgi:hypothetical protein